MRRRLRWLRFVCIFSFVSAATARADQSTWEKYVEQVRLLRQKGDFAAAEKAALAAIAEVEKSGLEDAKLARSWNNLGAIYYDTGRYAEAEKLFRRAVELWEKLFGPENSTRTQTYSNLAVLYIKMGRLSDAEPILVRLLALREKTLPPDHGDIAESLNNLAELYRA